MRRKINTLDIEYDKSLLQPGSSWSILLLKCWQVVIYQNKINFIVPTTELLTSRNHSYLQTCYANHIFVKQHNETDFCPLRNFINCAMAHPFTGCTSLRSNTVQILKFLHSFDVKEKEYHELELIEGYSFRDYVYDYLKNDGLKSDDVVVMSEPLGIILSRYIAKAVEKYNTQGDKAMEFFIQNQKCDTDMWKCINLDKNNKYIWGNSKKNVSDNELPTESETTKLKKETKEQVKTKFVRGNIYKLRIKGITGTESQTTKYQCRQIIHTIKNEAVNIVIMKALDKHPIPNHQIYCLNRYDCKKYHIKYEEGLEVFSQLMNWIPVIQQK